MLAIHSVYMHVWMYMNVHLCVLYAVCFHIVFCVSYTRLPMYIYSCVCLLHITIGGYETGILSWGGSEATLCGGNETHT